LTKQQLSDPPLYNLSATLNLPDGAEIQVNKNGLSLNLNATLSLGIKLEPYFLCGALYRMDEDVAQYDLRIIGGNLKSPISGIVSLDVDS
jgi:hypothetical protein